jgi:hypothetical protein
MKLKPIQSEKRSIVGVIKASYNNRKEIKMRNLTNDELVLKLNEIFTELRERRVLRSNNFVGDLGEYLILSYYNRINPDLGFTLAPPNQQSYDALDSQGKRYSIKTTRSKETSF